MLVVTQNWIADQNNGEATLTTLSGVMFPKNIFWLHSEPSVVQCLLSPQHFFSSELLRNRYSLVKAALFVKSIQKSIENIFLANVIDIFS